MKTLSTLARFGALSALVTTLLPAVAAPVAAFPAPALLDGFKVEWVQVSTSPHSTTDALNALNGAGGFTVLATATQYLSTINLNDGTVPFAGADPLFAVRVSGFVTLAAGSYSFLSFHDDGLRIRVGGETVVDFPTDTANIDTDSAFYDLAAGVYAYEAIGWEQGGAFNLQLGIDTGNSRDFLPGSHAADVPEPSALALVGLALAGLGLQRRRRTAA